MLVYRSVTPSSESVSTGSDLPSLRSPPNPGENHAQFGWRFVHLGLAVCWVGFTPTIKSRMARKNPAKSPKHPLKNMMVNENVFKNHILDFCSWMFLDLIYLGILWFLLKKLRRSSVTTLQARLLWHRSYWTAAPWSPKMYADTGLHLKRDCPGNPAARHFFF